MAIQTLPFSKRDGKIYNVYCANHGFEFNNLISRCTTSNLYMRIPIKASLNRTKFKLM